jgi:LDH2 family malate/lactate/ureidoglycolate dehydrogenase
MGTLVASVESLYRFCVQVLQTAGLGTPQAEIVSESLIFAELRGIDSHGLIRLASYLQRIESGVMEPNPQVTTINEAPAMALVDAHNGFGQVAGTVAMTLAIEKARSSGIAAVAVRNSNHFGVAAYFAMKALQAKMVGITLTNASPGIAPYGTRQALFGTNPIAFAVPALEQRPIVLDMASSVVARGKIRLAQLAGEKIPLDWALDAEGGPTDDPVAALKGTMAAVGGPKGSGLSLVIDVLCGILSGSCLTGDVRNITDTSGPCQTGHLMIAVDPAKFVKLNQFLSDIDGVILRIKALPSANGGSVYLPGELEAILEEKRRTEGIPLDADLQSSLNTVASRYGIGKFVVSQLSPF